jgi:ATP-dependent Clp protease adaptor protein ClpS
MFFDLADILWQQSEPRLAYDSDVLENEDVLTTIALPYKVILYNDNTHTFDEVIQQVTKAIGCSATRAEAIAWEVHSTGKSVVFDGEMSECLRVSAILEEIALHTQVMA